MFRLSFFILIGITIGLTVATEFSQVVPSYTTQQNQFAYGRETRYFRARLCGGCDYHNRKATVSVNMPKDKWDASSGQVIHVHVYSSSGKEIASNVMNSANPIPKFNFIYNKLFSDLTITAHTGSAPSFVFKIVVSFSDLDAYYGKNLCESRGIVTEEEAKMHGFSNQNAIRTTSHPVVDLVPTFVFVEPFKVMTNEVIGFQLHYCFPKDLPYNVLFNVLGNDDTSAFSLFACTKSQKNCDSETQLHDSSSASTVWSKFAIESEDDSGPIRLLVKGRGRLGQMNTFNLFASTYYKGGKGY